MTTDATIHTTARRGQRLKSVGAVFFPILIVTILSIVIDQVFHALKVYPPWGMPMYDPALNLLALTYRIPIDTFGSYLTARWAPHTPMRHVWVGAVIAIVLTAVGGVATASKGMGPSWFPILLVVSVIPTAWLGGRLWIRNAAQYPRT